MIEIKKGNVLNSKSEVIAHQVNCRGVMGSGVAKAIKQKYPEVFTEYAKYCSKYDALLGTTQLIEANDGKFIANLFGQDNYGTNTQQTNYKAVYSSLLDLKSGMKYLGLKTLSFPYMIGCGLAGGDIKTVMSLISEVFDDSGIIYNFYDINA